MNYNIKAIETEYKGVLFRSRLEARNAVFYDELGIEWLYEYEAYELSDGSKYLPDFFLPGFNCFEKPNKPGIFVEVKPNDVIDPKAKLFAMDYGFEVLMACGAPAWKEYQLINRELPPEAWGANFTSKYLPMKGYNCGSRWNEYRMFVCPGWSPNDYLHYIDEKIIKAASVANSMRFERHNKKQDKPVHANVETIKRLLEENLDAVDDDVPWSEYRKDGIVETPIAVLWSQFEGMNRRKFK